MGEYYVSHSSDPWKKHKYIKKIGEGVNTVHAYAKTSSDYKQAKADEEKAKKAR